MTAQLVVAYAVLWVVLLKALFARARVIPAECARCGLLFERRELGQPVCRCDPLLASGARRLPLLVRRLALARGQEQVALDDRLGNLDELTPGVAGLGAEQLERALLVDAVALHQDALRPLRDGPATERPLQVPELGEALEDDLERALELVRLAVREIRRRRRAWRPL